MEIKKITPEEINLMGYNELIGIVKETNRPPGGKNSIFEIVNRLHLTEQSKVLEVGTSTGFTPIEISRLIKCKITSIDINKESLKEAEKRAIKEGYNNINFAKADINSLPFDAETFDIVIVGNVFSLMSDKEKALNECMRVCKKNGFIATIPMYYLKSPPENLVKEVSNAIKVNITPLYKTDWIKFFTIPELQIYWSKDFRFDYIEDEKIMEFCDNILKRDHLKKLEKETYKKLHGLYKKYIFLFRDNLSHMGHTILILSKRKIWEDPELFTGKEVK